MPDVMTTKPAPVPLAGVIGGYRFEASKHGYDIFDADTGAVVKIERGATTSAPATNAQRAKQWITNVIEPRSAVMARSWLD